MTKWLTVHSQNGNALRPIQGTSVTINPGSLIASEPRGRSTAKASLKLLLGGSHEDVNSVESLRFVRTVNRGTLPRPSPSIRSPRHHPEFAHDLRRQPQRRHLLRP